MKLKNCGRIARHELSNAIETIEACKSLDDLESSLHFFLMQLILDESNTSLEEDVRALLPHCYERVMRLVRQEEIEGGVS
jgi:hypothetical protein